MSSSLRIIVTGLIAQYPLGGVTWDYLQYLLGLARLGHEVYYIEDTGQWPYAPSKDGLVEGCEFNVEYLGGVMERFGLGDRWAYRFPWKAQWFGLSEERRTELIHSADLLLNISGTLERPQEYRAVRRMAYLDSDPVFTQVKLARGNDYLRKLIDLHDVLFSFGERRSEAVPDTGDEWIPTRQPIALWEWQPAADHRGIFTTVMNWSSYNPVEYAGRSYGQKNVEFERFLDLPAQVAPSVLELAAKSGRKHKLPRALLAHKGWKLVDPDRVCPDLDTYREYIRSSMAEWSVAKNGYVEGQSGWFSCRSACYLAAGRPVVVQETGFSDILPVGAGILPFRDLEGAIAAIEEVQTNHAHHAEAARAIAEECFDAEKVLSQLVARSMEDAT